MMLSAEDDRRMTIKPRLEAAGADGSRIKILNGKREVDGQMRLPQIPADCHVIEQLIDQHKVDVLVIDPIANYLNPKTDSHRDTDVRQCLYPLSDIAERRGVAIILMRHLSKSGKGDAITRGIGSIAFIAASRVGWMVNHHPEDESKVIFACSKNNLSKKPRSLVYEVKTFGDVGAIEWQGTTELSANDISIVKEGKQNRPGVAIQRCMEVIQVFLADGPQLATELEGWVCEDKGYSKSTYRRASKELGVKRHKENKFQGKWVCSLPETTDEPTDEDDF